ncbi:unnamed protein product [Citrullus colocynthis]|uniref:Secreted protein n=1 Tax=Citrullus colocynthis TaxID=252529 RepID=A0ABP0Z9G3_9ROSI
MIFKFNLFRCKLSKSCIFPCPFSFVCFQLLVSDCLPDQTIYCTFFPSALCLFPHSVQLAREFCFSFVALHASGKLDLPLSWLFLCTYTRVSHSAIAARVFFLSSRFLSLYYSFFPFPFTDHHRLSFIDSWSSCC